MLKPSRPKDTVELDVSEGSADSDNGLLFLLTKMRSENPPHASLLQNSSRCLNFPVFDFGATEQPPTRQACMQEHVTLGSNSTVSPGSLVALGA